jgi:NADH:ubiquinone oxidoreductase subunit 2 (subunit N)
MSNNLFITYLSLEIFSLSLVSMLSCIKLCRSHFIESSYKYFIYSSIGSVTFLLGCVFIYFGSGTLNFNELTICSSSYLNLSLVSKCCLILGIVLILMGVSIN